MPHRARRAALAAAHERSSWTRLAPILAQQRILDLLTSLVDQSLVELDASGERYRILETVPPIRAGEARCVVGSRVRAHAPARRRATLSVAIGRANLARVAPMAMHRPPTDDAFIATQISTARRALGDAAFARAEASGRALSYEQALHEAGAWLSGLRTGA